MQSSKPPKETGQKKTKVEVKTHHQPSSIHHPNSWRPSNDGYLRPSEPKQTFSRVCCPPPQGLSQPRIRKAEIGCSWWSVKKIQTRNLRLCDLSFSRCTITPTKKKHHNLPPSERSIFDGIPSEALPIFQVKETKNLESSKPKWLEQFLEQHKGHYCKWQLQTNAGDEWQKTTIHLYKKHLPFG